MGRATNWLTILLSMPRRDPDALFAARKVPKRLPFDFVLDELAGLGPWTRPMFGCHAVYVDERIIFVLRDKADPRCDDGVWIATTMEHHSGLRREFPSMRSISVLAQGGVTGWQILPAESEDFEDSVLRACALVREGDRRIGKVPKKRGAKKQGSKSAARGAKTLRQRGRRPPSSS
jgi:hypothetical protein